MARIIISRNEKRNMAQVVYHNVDANGKRFSLTRHEALDPEKGCSPCRRAKSRHENSKAKDQE